MNGGIIIKNFKKVKLVSFAFSLILVLVMATKIANFGLNILDNQYITISQEMTNNDQQDNFKILSLYKGNELIDVDDLEIRGWSESKLNYNKYPITSNGYTEGNSIRIKVDKDFLFNDLRIRYASGPNYWNANVNYQDKKNTLLIGNGKDKIYQETIHYSSWISVTLQYVSLLVAAFFLSLFINSIVYKLLDSDEKISRKKLIKIFKPYSINVIIFAIGLFIYDKLNKHILEESALSFFNATMTKNDIIIYLIFGFFISLGIRSLTANKYKHMNKITWLVFILNPLVSFMILESAYNPNLMSMEAIYVLINSFILLLIQLFIYFTFRFKKPAMVIVLIISIIFGVANDFLMLLRDSPLIPAFFGSLGVAADVANDTIISLNGMAISSMAVALIWLLTIISVKEGKIKINKKRYLASLGAFTGVLAVSIIVSANFFLNQVTVGVNLWRPSRTYYVEGAPYSFYRITVKQLITAPEGYDKKKVENILDSYYYSNGEVAVNDESSDLASSSLQSLPSDSIVENHADNSTSSQDEIKNSKLNEEDSKKLSSLNDKKPNIIMVQSESLADYYGLGNLKMNKDPMEYMKSLKENTIHGYTFMSVIGGGTVNSEFETLTSLPLAFFPSGAYPFQQYVKDGHTSVGRVLENQGYDTFITHPNKPTNYSRQEVWPNLGFKNSAFIDDYPDATYVHNFVSDETLYKKVIDKYKNKGDKPLFSYLVTMQNHGAYTGAYKSDNIQILGHQGENKGADEYLNLVNVSDNDFKELVSFFENYDEPTIICVFGDHQPSIYNYYLDIAYGENNYTDEDIYKTPLTIWANYDIEEEDNVNISLNYLSAYLFEKAGGIEHSAYEKYLLDMMEDYPVITTRFVLDKYGKDVKNDETFIKKNNELNSLIYYEVKDQNETNKYFNFPAQSEY